MNLAVRHVTGKEPDAYLSDYRNRNHMRMQELKEAIGVLHEDERFYTPDPAAREAYRRGYERYCMLYPANKPLFDRED